ncbi:MAG TPA: cbb3-type cytochrome c oxidase subunit I [Polyangiaceae bacterium]|nr:cbb3-type cytochrome c oxidase subunit I [Polyangiaceae bacterium]
MEIQYRSQRLAYGFFVSMLVLFLVQVAFGLLLAAIQWDPYLLQGVLHFNVARAFHLNLGIVWIVTGFAGTLVFIGPLLGGREMRPAWLVKALLVAIWAIVLWSAFTLPLAQKGIAGWKWNQPWLQQGLEYLEGGRITDILLLVGFATLMYIVVHVFPSVRKWSEIHWGLAIGLGGLATMWLFAFVSARSLDLQEYFRWYVVHYWVEGVWEILHISLVGFLLQKFFDADEREVGFAVFWGVALVALTGLIGNAHHYFWIGTPSFWQFWGSLFSALEPLPMLFCIWHVFLDAKHGDKPLRNKAAFYFIVGSAVFELVGAGVLGFSQTFALTNLWEHGTWVTPAHGHMALFGTFGFLVIGAAYVAIPAIHGIERFDERLSKLAFWTLLTGMLGMVLSFAAGGTIEAYVYRVLGLDWFGEQVRPAMAVPRAMLGIFGLLFATGAVTAVYDLTTIRSRALADDQVDSEPRPLAQGRWAGTVTTFEMGAWIGVMWFFGMLVTLGLLSFNLHTVRMGDPTIPYTLASLGYPGLLGTTLAFTVRFLRAFEARQASLTSAPVESTTSDGWAPGAQQPSAAE